MMNNEAKILSLLEQMNGRFDSVDARLDGMDARFDKVDARLDKMDARLDKMDARLDGMDARLDKMEVGLDETNKRLGKLEGRFDDLAGIMITFENTISRKIESLFDGYKLTHDAQWEFARKLAELEKRLEAVELRQA